MPAPELGHLVITVTAHWVNRWFLHTLARPFVEVDGVERALAWGRPTSFEVRAGEVEVATFVRYRGTRTPLGRGALRVQVPAGETLRVHATNGVRNGTPFTPRAVGDDGRGSP